MLEDLVNIAQVGLTITFVLSCALLLSTWRTEFFEAIKSRKLTPEQWLVAGIVIGFAGNALDNGYWGIQWLIVLYSDSLDNPLLRLGPMANVIFRQIPGIISVYCHLRAAVAISGAEYSLNRKFTLYAISGAFVSVMILLSIP